MNDLISESLRCSSISSRLSGWICSTSSWPCCCSCFRNSVCAALGYVTVLLLTFLTTAMLESVFLEIKEVLIFKRSRDPVAFYLFQSVYDGDSTPSLDRDGESWPSSYDLFESSSAYYILLDRISPMSFIIFWFISYFVPVGFPLFKL